MIPGSQGDSTVSKLPKWAHGDTQGISTYPLQLGRIGGAALLHIDEGGPACGASIAKPYNLVEYLGDRQHKVCCKCRAVIEARP